MNKPDYILDDASLETLRPWGVDALKDIIETAYLDIGESVEFTALYKGEPVVLTRKADGYVWMVGAEEMDAPPKTLETVIGFMKALPDASEDMSEREFYVIEAATQLGFDYIDDDAEVLVCHQKTLAKLVTHARALGWRDAQGEAADVARRFAKTRSMREGQPNSLVRGRWEGEQNASVQIADQIMTLTPPERSYGKPEVIEFLEPPEGVKLHDFQREVVERIKDSHRVPFEDWVKDFDALTTAAQVRSRAEEDVRRIVESSKKEPSE